MNERTLRVLVVDGAGGGPLALPERDGLGTVQRTRCTGLGAAAEALAAGEFEAVALVVSAADLAALPAWPALPRAVAEAAVLVFCDGVPDAALAVRLVQLGVQDVAPLPAADAGLALRLAVERRALQRSVRKAHGTDLMTGLPDQAQLTEHMTQLLALREREPAPMALLAVRLDGLAAVEARLGREAANALRRKVAVRLRVGLRAGDVVAALGPDMLGALLSRMQDPQDAQRVADKLLHALKAPFTLSGGEAAVAAAIGAARYPQDGKDAATLLRVATGLAAAAPAAGRGAAAAANDPV